MSPLRVVFAGTPEIAVPALQAIEASDHRVVAVLSKPDAPVGRGKKIAPSAVSLAAEESGLPLYRPKTLHGIGEVLDAHAADVVAVVAYGLLVPPDALHVPRLGWINAHFSDLPSWRGAAPVQHAIAAGDEQISVTTFRIDAGLDTGPILLRSDPVAIEEREDSGALLGRLAPIGADLLVRTLDGLSEGSLVPRPQEDAGASLAPQISTADARIDWTRPVVEIERWIRACTPSPGAWTTVGEDRLGIGPAQAVELADDAVPGRLVADRKQVRIGAGGGYLVLGEVRPQGKKAMPADAWARGRRGEFPDAV